MSLIANSMISGMGVYTPSQAVSNAELVAAFNRYVVQYNETHATEIAAGQCEPLALSDTDFIIKASGIEQRFLLDAAGVLDPQRLRPAWAARPDEALSLQAEIAISAAQDALAQAELAPDAIDVVIVACSNLQRPYPAVAIEVQAALGCAGFAYDMNVACSSATFGLQQAANHIATGKAKHVLMVNPEICSVHLDFHNRDCHFIFGDVCTAVVISAIDQAPQKSGFHILDIALATRFSNNIRNNFGFLNRVETATGQCPPDYLFSQQGRKVFKEVTPLVVNHIESQLARLSLSASDLKRLWLHQSNSHMNRLIAEKILGFKPTPEQTPSILERYANTSSAGVIVALKEYHDDLADGDLGLLSSFGAGYSVGSVLLQKTG